MAAQDSKGNNVLHSVILLANVNTSLALKVFDSLLALTPTWTLKSTTCDFLKPLSPESRLKHGKQLLFLTPNSDGYTPLKLAAKLGVPAFVDKILNIDDVYRFDYFSCGVKSHAWYDMSEVDPALGSYSAADTPEVLECMSIEQSVNHLYLFQLPILQRASQLKIQAYWPHLAVGCLLHTAFMFVFTLLSSTFLPHFYQAQNDSVTNEENSASLNGVEQADDSRYTLHLVDYVLLVYAIIVFMYVCLAGRYVYKLSLRNHFSFYQFDSYFHVLNLSNFGSFSLTSITYFILKWTASNTEVYFLCGSFLFGWMCVFLSTRLFHSTTHFTVMMDYIVKKDMFRFVLVMLIITLAIVTVALILLSFDNAPSDSLFYPIHAAFNFLQFAFSVSLIDEAVTEATQKIALTILYYIFTFSVNILMVNLLIAAMNYTYGTFGKFAPLFCRKIHLMDFLVLEAVLPLFLQGKGSFYRKRVVTSWRRNGKRQDRKLYLLDVVTTDDGNAIRRYSMYVEE